MSRLAWDKVGTRRFESGVDRGVLYVPGLAGVPWNGLISVSERPIGGLPVPYYIDGVRYLNEVGNEEVQVELKAFTYPDEFMQCDGQAAVEGGLYAFGQARSAFNLSYRTKVGNDISGIDLSYKIHLIYNAVAAPASRDHQTFGEQISPEDFSWTLSTIPVEFYDTFKPSAHFVINSAETSPSLLATIEDMLYGTESVAASMPSITDIILNIQTASGIQIIDNGDGSWTAIGPSDRIQITGSEFVINSTSATYLSSDTYRLRSM